MHDNEDKTADDEEDLEEELDETATSLPCEATPCLQEANVTSSSHHLADNLAAKGAIEGNDGVLVLREDGSLDADKSDDGRKAEEQRAHDRKHDHDDAADDQARGLGTVVLADLLGVEVVETEEHANAAGKVDADVWHSGVDGGRECEDLPASLAREAVTEEGLGGRHGDNLVGPGGVYVGYGHAAECCDQDSLAWDAGKSGGEEGRDEGEEHRVKDVNPVATESGETSTVCDEVLEGSADARGHGLLVDEGNGRTGLKEALLLLFVGGLVGGG